MQGVFVNLAIHRNSLDAELLSCPHHSACNLASITNDSVRDYEWRCIGIISDLLAMRILSKSGLRSSVSFEVEETELHRQSEPSQRVIGRETYVRHNVSC